MSAGGKSAAGQVDKAYAALTDSQRSDIASGQAAFNTGIAIPDLNGTTPAPATAQLPNTPAPVPGTPEALYNNYSTVFSPQTTPPGVPQATAPQQAQQAPFDYGPMVSQMQQYVQSMQQLFDSYKNRG